ncbi:MAG: hypothetical protein ACI398_07585 [Clostridium sp.]
MKKLKKVAIICMLITILIGCSKSEQSTRNINNVNNADKVLDEVTDNTDKETSNNDESSADKYNEMQNQQKYYTGKSEEDCKNSKGDNIGIDYDLTKMGSDMVYATVYQIMLDPNSYIGKKIRMKGTYYAAYSESSERRYNYCIIKDAAGCCAQGIEFVCDDDNVHEYEYPAENSEIVVTGIFETYQEDGDSNLYCHLKDAEMKIE